MGTLSALSSTIIGMSDDDATLAAPADAPLPTTEIDPATAADGPLAYSAHTASMPVVEYQAPRLRPVWIIMLVVAAAAAVAAAAFVLGRSTAPPEPTIPLPAASTTTPPPVAAPTPEPVALPPAPAPPPTAVAAVPPAPPTATTSIPPLATPQARIAEPIICSLHYQYPEMQPVDLALSLVDRGIYSTYDEASLVVGLVLKDGCHGI